MDCFEGEKEIWAKNTWMENVEMSGAFDGRGNGTKENHNKKQMIDKHAKVKHSWRGEKANDLNEIIDLVITLLKWAFSNATYTDILY